MLHALRLRGPLADDPTARVLNALLLTLAIWFGVATVVAIRLTSWTSPRMMAVLTAEVTPIVALLLLRRGRFRSAVLVYLSGTWLFATIAITFNGGIRSPLQAFLVTLPISAAWLLGNAGALWSATACIGTGLVFMIFELMGVSFPRLIPGSAFGVWATLVQACLIGAVPVAQVLRRLREALEELNANKQGLEKLVEERTADLVTARDQAEAANKAKSAFLASMSHELRTPLNVILGVSELLRDGFLTRQQLKDLNTIKRSGQHLLALISDVLDMAKIEAGQLALEVENCEVGALVREVADIMRVRAELRRLSLQIDGPAGPLHIRADVARLRQILINLLGNAIQYTERGSVTLRWNARPAENGERFRLMVEAEDTGIGIAAEDQQRIFEPFVQVGNRKNRKGTGLGLPITRQFVELMGGTIGVDSLPGRGSCFRVDIPVERSSEPEFKGGEVELAGGVELEPGQPHYRVLVVDDDPDGRMVLGRLLKRAGFDVLVAEDGEAAMEKFKEWRPQFIWMDLRMPVIDGAEATRRIRAVEGGGEVRIAGLTASGVAIGREEARQAGLDDYVRKPYRPGEIFECMERHLGVRCRLRVEAIRNGADKPDRPLQGDDFSDLPAELRDELRDSIISLDIVRISDAIQKVTERSGPLGEVLARYASQYSYTAILAAVGWKPAE